MKLKTILMGAGFLLSACGGGGLAVGGNALGVAEEGRFIGAMQELSNLLQKDPSVEADIIPMAIAPTKSIYDACSTFTIGSAITDAVYEIQYNCRDIINAGDKYTKLGTIGRNVIDKSDLSKGYRYYYDVIYDNIDGGAHQYAEYDGLYELKRTGQKITYINNFGWKFKSDNYKPILLDWNYQWETTRVYTPDDMNNPFDSGSFSVEGIYVIKGSLGPDTNGRQVSANVGFKIESEDMTYDKTCGRFFKSGSLIYEDGAKNRLELKYDCSTIEYYVNGRFIQTL